MRRIFSKLLYEIEEERNTMLVTVIADRGSAPRGAGAAMLVGEKGRITGTIGGGAVEYQSEKKAMELLKAGESAVHEFVLRPNDKEDIGMQCGGSDAFSGLTANPSAGYAADMLVKGGATVLFSEVTEVRDGVHLLAARCRDAATRDKLAAEMKWYDDYLEAGGVGRDANPTPGNKKGGLANIVEKAMGSIAKSGTAPIEEVLSPAEKPHKHGLIYAATPASDIVCGPSQLASGIGLQVFMTGRGTPYGLAAAPVIKVCSRNEMKAHWFDLIDVNAGPIATGEKTIAEVGTELFHLILDVASGIRQPYSDQYGFHNDLCIFNPAPIT